MKISEVFLEYAEPSRTGLPNNVTIDQLKRALRVPELVWNAVVLDRDKNRKPGQLPKLLTTTIETNFPKSKQREGTTVMSFWVNRKDIQFANYPWPIVTEVYENLKKELIVRVEIRGDEALRDTFPKEWNNKKPARVISIDKE